MKAVKKGKAKVRVYVEEPDTEPYLAREVEITVDECDVERLCAGPG